MYSASNFLGAKGFNIYIYRCSNCRGLYSLTAECVIICLTVLHLLATTVEILIHIDLIHGKSYDSCIGSFFPWLSLKYKVLNPCHAESITIPRPVLIFSQSDYFIQVADTNSNS